MNIKLIIITSSADILKDPREDAELLTQGLFGENVIVLKKNKSYSFVKLVTDGYLGWINNNSIGHLSSGSHIITTIRTFIFLKPNIKSKTLGYLSIGSIVNVEHIKNCWAKITLNSCGKYKFGYVFSKHLSKNKNKLYDWVKTAEGFINTPYKWGGRNSLGIDCSALLQLSLQTADINFPRDTIDQIKSDLLETITFQNVERGSLIFWERHIGIFVSKQQIIHSNAYHMKTVIEDIENVFKRKDTSKDEIKRIATLKLSF